MKTNRIFRQLSLAAMVILLTGCGNDWLNVTPSNRVETGRSITTIGDAKSAIDGVYYQIQRSSYYGGRMMWYADICGDDMRTHGNSSTRSGATYRYEYTENSVPNALWSQPYAVIRQANNILSLIDGIEAATEAETAEKNFIKGEAYMARALAHFDICRIHGFPYTKDNGASLGASIVTAPVEATAQPARSTVAECYNQVVIPDLIEAIKLLSPDKAASKGRFNRWAAKLLLSRVYLYKNDNANALREAEECIEGAEAAGWALYTNENYLAQWKTKFSDESLFEIINITGQNTGNDGIPNWCASNSTSAYHELGLTRSFYDLLTADPDDVRIGLLTKGVNYPDLWEAFILKYTSGGNVANESNVIVYRLSEAYLIAAEAAVKESLNDKAVKYLDAIVGRANPSKSVSGTVTLDQVLTERRKELFGEGHRSFDVLRNGMTIRRTGDDHSSLLQVFEIDRDDNFCVLPIPIDEIESNPAIVQNP